MNKISGAILAVTLVAGGGTAYYISQSQSQTDFGAASPRVDSADISIDWLLSEGELTLGNQEIGTPLGVNLKLLVDSDRADSIEIEGLGVRMPLAADAITTIHFNAHKAGRFPIRLSSTGEALGRVIVQP
ncbi:MAG: hypothetical protein ACSHXK_02700 [Oceanococcus sp.]